MSCCSSVDILLCSLAESGSYLNDQTFTYDCEVALLGVFCISLLTCVVRNDE